MSGNCLLRNILVRANEKERDYDWLNAVEFHKKVLASVLRENDSLKAGEIQERIGFCLHRAAMQAETREELKERIRQAVEDYEKATEFYSKVADEQKEARISRCKAIIKYLGYWLASEASEKRKVLDECLELEGKALAVFSESGNMLQYGRTYVSLPLVFWCRVPLEWNRQISKDVLEQGLEWGEKAVAALSQLGSPQEIAEAYFVLAVCYSSFGYSFIPDLEDMDENQLKVAKYLDKVIDLSGKAGDDRLIVLSHVWLGENTGGEEAIKHFEKALEHARRTRDSFLIAVSLDYLGEKIYWKAMATEDPEKRKELAGKAMELYDQGKRHYSVLSFISPRGGVIGPPDGYAEYYLHLAAWETDSRKRLEFLKKSEKAGMQALKPAETSDMPTVIWYMHHVVSKTLEARGRSEEDVLEKKILLESALEHREKTIKIGEQILPFEYFNRGLAYNYLAGIKAELASIETNLQSKRTFLEEAVKSQEECLSLCTKIIPYFERIGHIEPFVALQWYQDKHATLLMQLCDLTGNPEQLRKAIEVLQRSIESAKKLDMVSPAAVSYWKIARALDALGEHLDSAENFRHASENYAMAAERIPQLKGFYQDYASYMEAWGEIEKAKHCHAAGQYALAKEHYEKAASFHKSTERWGYLGLNYLAWSRLEEAEDLSRREQTGNAKEVFQETASLFAEAKKSIENALEKIELRDEKEMASELVEASNIREAYCLGRSALEEARILHRHGDPVASSKKYGTTAGIFQEIAYTESAQSRMELEPIIYLCQAWQKMMMAEAKASSVTYGDAAELFRQAKEHALDQSTALLALASYSFCRALEAGTEFEVTRDASAYSTAKKHMEAAANYYLKAGFKNGSDYARATQRLFDAYIYMDKAETETEPVNKAKYYELAERLLQISTNLYLKAKHDEKSEEVRRLLGKVREGKKLAVSLSEVLGAPEVVSTTTSFFTPKPTHEKPVGLERFEHAYIQAYLVASEMVNVGEELEVRLDLVNIARNACLLVRVDDLVPSGFETIALPSQFSVEKGSVDMKGKKLEPLKVESIKLVLRASEAVVINLSPQVIYVDEDGKLGTCRPKPVGVTVCPKLAFEFGTKAAQSAFDFLTGSFVEDYMRRRLPLEKSGWRTLMDIVRHGNVPKSSVYRASGHRGPAVSELERRGLVEMRIFPGERGRGGRILKSRISYEKETVKRHIDEQVMKNKEK